MSEERLILGSPVYEACVTIIAAADRRDRGRVVPEEVDDFWRRVLALEALETRRQREHWRDIANGRD
jgi:hypothetical protein